VDPDHVVVASGCSGALELALTAALEQDGSSVLLVPSPGFPLYRVIAESHGCPVAPYRLRVTSEGWQVDVEHLDELLLRYGGSRNPVIVVNNPSNPTGAVFSVGHLRELIRLCDRHHVPVVADEVYGDMTFAGRRFHPLAEVAASMGRTVPVVTASGLGKQYLIPGWRVGWIVFQDKYVLLLKCFPLPFVQHETHTNVSFFCFSFLSVSLVPCAKWRQEPNVSRK
jgi:tyrosine aminotransferase